MLITKLYQTIDDRGKQKYAPICCKADDAWLGKGFYFWDTRIEDAHWWGQSHYNGIYAICESEYDYHSLEYFDLMGNVGHRDYFLVFAEAVIKRHHKDYTVGEIIEILKKIDKNFKYKAIRALPEDRDGKMLQIRFDKANNYYLPAQRKTQMCVIDTTFLLNGKYDLIYSSINEIIAV